MAAFSFEEGLESEDDQEANIQDTSIMGMLGTLYISSQGHFANRELREVTWCGVIFDLGALECYTTSPPPPPPLFFFRLDIRCPPRRHGGLGAAAGPVGAARGAHGARRSGGQLARPPTPFAWGQKRGGRRWRGFFFFRPRRGLRWVAAGGRWARRPG